MANIKPFRGLRYNPELFCDLSEVVTLPYDRIHEAEQAAYYEVSPYSFVRIIQGKSTPADNDKNNVYTRARAYMETWLAENVLIRDPVPVLYVLEQTFTTPDNDVKYVRRGLTAALNLTYFDEGEVLPHERTLQGPKEDRLNLTRATETSWGHIFMLYPDEEAEINALLQPFLDSHMPAIVSDRVIEPDVEQAFWVVNDPDVVAAVVEAMKGKGPLIIADGHHRYETALGYRDEMREKADAAPDAAFNYVLATFVSMSDPGLVVLPTHRLIHSYTRMDSQALLGALEPYFTVVSLPDRDALAAALAEAAPDRPRFGFYDGTYTLLTLKSLAVMADLLPDRDPSFRKLDVTVLHELIIEHVMGLSKESVSRHENLTYLRDPTPGYAAVDSGEANFLFLLNPTQMAHIRDCTAAGERMPQKSTDFYPKIVGGLVALPLSGVMGD
ncbi:MAG: DUF1015 domain-containing protein [Anaerolineae bacterium]|nr:DUF1015 domain-containing protein [Anaerolineae bacterium]